MCYRVINYRMNLSLHPHTYTCTHTRTHTSACDLLEWLTGCRPANQQWMIVKRKLNNTVISQLIRLQVSTGLPKKWAPVPVKEWMCYQDTLKANRKRANASSHLKIQIKDACLPTSRVQTRSGFIHFKPSKTVSHRCASFLDCVHSICSQVDTSNRKPRPEVEETTGSKNHRSLLTSLLSYLSYITQSTCIRTALPTVGWVLPH